MSISRRAFFLLPFVPIAKVFADEIYLHDFENGKVKNFFTVKHRKTSFFEHWSIVDEEKCTAADLKKRGVGYTIQYCSRTVNAFYKDSVVNDKVEGYLLDLELVNHQDIDISMHCTEKERIGDVFVDSRFGESKKCTEYACLDEDVQTAISDGIQEFFTESRRMFDRAGVSFSRF